jgi:hypothetical protein
MGNGFAFAWRIAGLFGKTEVVELRKQAVAVHETPIKA